MVLWLLGISGAGKTTLGSRLRDYLTGKGIKSYMLDGDEVRDVFGNDLGFTKEEREAHIKRIILAAYALDRCNIAAVVCVITPFQHLRDLAREKIGGYREIYIKKDLNASMENDVKGVYGDNRGKTDLVGININFDEPRCPDLVIETDKETIEESLGKIIRYIEGQGLC